MEGSIINLPEVIALKKKYKVSSATLCGYRVLPYPFPFPAMEVKMRIVSVYHASDCLCPVLGICVPGRGPQYWCSGRDRKRRG